MRATTTLHGGKVGFDKAFWQLDRRDATTLVLKLVSPDGDQGFPGELTVYATYHLKDHALCLALEAQTTKATPVSLSAHPYFNLAGLSAGDVLDHEFTIAADAFLPTDAKQIPTGEIRPVDGTVFDFRKPMTAAARIRHAEPQLRLRQGIRSLFCSGKSAPTERRALPPVPGTHGVAGCSRYTRPNPERSSTPAII